MLFFIYLFFICTNLYCIEITIGTCNIFFKISHPELIDVLLDLISSFSPHVLRKDTKPSNWPLDLDSWVGVGEMCSCSDQRWVWREDACNVKCSQWVISNKGKAAASLSVWRDYLCASRSHTSEWPLYINVSSFNQTFVGTQTMFAIISSSII